MKHLFRLIFNSRSLGLLMLALILPLSINPVGAKPNCDRDPPPGSCDGDGGGDSNFRQTMSDNLAIWGPSVDVPVDDPVGVPYELVWLKGESYVLQPAVSRFCDGEGGDPATNPNPKGGLGYICHQDHDFLYGKEQWNVVYLDLSDLDLCVEGENCDGALIADGRDDDLCERLVDEDNGNFPMEIVPAKEKDPPGCTDPPDPYCLDDEDGNVGRLSSYYIVLHESNDEHCTWDRNLEKTSCKVRIALRGYFHNESSGTKSGRLVGLNAWGHVIPAPFVKGKPTEINPFTRHQDIKIEELTVYFRGIGTNRTVASCYYDNRVYLDDEIVPGKFLNEDIVFRTTCVGKGCNTPSQ